MTPSDKFVNVLFDARQLSALEHVKRVKHFSTSGDAVRACVLDAALAIGWVEPELPPKSRKPRKKMAAIDGLKRRLVN
jgi:hypothetical protein